MKEKVINNTNIEEKEEPNKVSEDVQLEEDEENLDIETEDEYDDKLVDFPEENNLEESDDIDLDSGELLADDFGDEFKTDEDALNDEGSFSEDFGSYAKGFPDWDLLPPKD